MLGPTKLAEAQFQTKNFTLKKILKQLMNTSFQYIFPLTNWHATPLPSYLLKCTCSLIYPHLHQFTNYVNLKMPTPGNLPKNFKKCTGVVLMTYYPVVTSRKGATSFEASKW